MLWLRAVWRGQRVALLRAPGGGGLLARALQLLSAHLAESQRQRGADSEELLTVCLEAAAELTEPLVVGGDGPLPGTPLGSQPLRPAEVATAELAVAASREVALGLL